MSIYRKILSQSWKVTWDYKYLWFFGIFAALLGAGGEYEIFFRIFSSDANQAIFPGWQKFIDTGFFSVKSFSNLSQIIKDDPASLIISLIVMLVIVALAAFLIWLAVVSQIALISDSAKYLLNKKTKITTTGDEIKNGVENAKAKLWPVLYLNIIIKVVIYLEFLIVSLPIVLTINRPASFKILSVYLATFFVLIVLSLVFSFIIKYAIAYIVVKDKNLIDSLKNGWQLFAKNWLVSIEMAVILFFINFFAAILLLVAVLIIAIPLLFLAMAVYKFISIAIFWLALVVAFAILLAVIVVGGSIIFTFQISSWTNLFLELDSRGGVSKIVRIFSRS